jgi:hypothetical protein
VKDFKLMTVYGDGIHDDTEALQAYLDGKTKLIHPDGTIFGLKGGKFKITKTLIIDKKRQMEEAP